MSWPKTGGTFYHAQLGHSDKGRAKKELGVYIIWGYIVFGPGKRSGPRWYKPSPKAWLVKVDYMISLKECLNDILNKNIYKLSPIGMHNIYLNYIVHWLKYL